MVSIAAFRKLALALPGAEELPHFEKPSFRVKKKIFATLHEKDKRAMLMLTPEDQSVFCLYDATIFIPVPGFWGAKGATFVDLTKVRTDMCKDALSAAHASLQKKRAK